MNVIWVLLVMALIIFVGYTIDKVYDHRLTPEQRTDRAARNLKGVL